MAESTIRAGGSAVVESREAVEASLKNPDVRAFFRDLAQIAPPEPVLTEVVSVHTAAARPS